MYTFNGIGTRLYGKRDFNAEDNTYIATKWFVFLYFPIIPLGSYRVLPTGNNQYHMQPINYHWPQIKRTYLVGIAIAVLFYTTYYFSHTNQ